MYSLFNLQFIDFTGVSYWFFFFKLLYVYGNLCIFKNYVVFKHGIQIENQIIEKMLVGPNIPRQLIQTIKNSFLFSIIIFFRDNQEHKKRIIFLPKNEQSQILN